MISCLHDIHLLSQAEPHNFLTPISSRARVTGYVRVSTRSAAKNDNKTRARASAGRFLSEAGPGLRLQRAIFARKLAG